MLVIKAGRIILHSEDHIQTQENSQIRKACLPSQRAAESITAAKRTTASLEVILTQGAFVLVSSWLLSQRLVSSAVPEDLCWMESFCGFLYYSEQQRICTLILALCQRKFHNMQPSACPLRADLSHHTPVTCLLSNFWYDGSSI